MENIIGQLSELLKVEGHIAEIYSTLYNLELEGKKDNDEYNKNVESLKLLLQDENNQLKDMNLTPERVELLLEYLKSNFGVPRPELTLFDTVLNMNQKLNPVNRVVMKLYAMIKNGVYNNLNKEIDKVPNAQVTIFGDKLMLDCNKQFMALLQNQINNKQNGNRNYLTQLKYAMSFNDHDVEQFTLITPEQLYIEEEKNITDEEARVQFINVRDRLSFTNFMDYFNKTICVSNEKYTKEQLINLAVIQLYMRALLATTSAEFIEIVYDSFKKNAENNKKLGSSYDISIGMISSVFKLANSDKERYMLGDGHKPKE